MDSKDTRFCPFRKSELIEFLELDGEQSQTREHFAPCLEDKCAMWRVERRSQFVATAKDVGYCGLAGKP